MFREKKPAVFSSDQNYQKLFKCESYAQANVTEEIYISVPSISTYCPSTINNQLERTFRNE
jgi:hypothetical protein